MRFCLSSTVNAAALALLIAGCKEPAPPLEHDAAAAPTTPSPRVSEEPGQASPPTPAPVVRSDPPSRPETVADLDARFHARSTTPDDRDEIIQTLGRLDALPTLRRIFDEEK